ncbi:MAG: hypothetical protein ABSF80_07865 [Chitinispirillaceae bacterium]|jgi:hypothetical protein
MNKILVACILIFNVSLAIAGEILDLGHINSISLLKRSGNTILSQDSYCWVLWNITDTSIIAKGKTGTVDLKNGTFIIGKNDSLYIFKYPDFLTSTAILKDSINFRLTYDGNYIWGFNKNYLRVWNPQGIQLASIIGNFSSASDKISIDTSGIYIVDSTTDSIEVYSVLNSSKLRTVKFNGVFNSWFLDGQRFITVQGTIVRIYSTSGSQEAINDIGTLGPLRGYGEYYWYFLSGAYPNYPITIYKVGLTNSVKIINTGVLTTVIPTYGCIGILQWGVDSFSVVSLLKDSVTVINNKGSGPFLTALDADTLCNWTTGNRSGVVNYGISSGSPNILNHGNIRALAGTPNGYFAAAASSGQLLIYRLIGDVATRIDTFNLNSGDIQLSSDGSILACRGSDVDAQYSPNDLSLSAYYLTSHTLIRSWYHNYFHETGSDYLWDFDLSNDGLFVSQKTGRFNSVWSYTNIVSKIQNDSTIFTDNFIYERAPQISPDNQYIANIDAANNLTKIYNAGILTNAISGHFSGWLNGNLLVIDSSVYQINGQIDTSYHFNISGNRFQSISDSEVCTNNGIISDIKKGKILYNVNYGNTLNKLSVPVGSDYILYNYETSLQLIKWRDSVAGVKNYHSDIFKSEYSLNVKVRNNRLLITFYTKSKEDYTISFFRLNGSLFKRYSLGTLYPGWCSKSFNLNQELIAKGVMLIIVKSNNVSMATRLINITNK